jgi:hypothetical protein
MKQDIIQAEVANIKRSRMMLTIFVLLFICVIFWTVVSLINTQNETAISPDLSKSATALTPTINDSVLTQLEQEREFTDEELASFVIYRFISAEVGDAEVLLPLGEEPSSPADTTTTRPTPAPTPTTQQRTTPATSAPTATPSASTGAGSTSPGNTLGVTTQEELPLAESESEAESEAQNNSGEQTR